MCHIKESFSLKMTNTDIKNNFVCFLFLNYSDSDQHFTVNY